MDQLPRLGKRELICLLLFTCNYVFFVRRSFLFLWVLGMDYVILLWHSLSLPYNYFTCLGFFFLLKRPTWSRPSEAIFVPTEASKTFNDVTNRTSVYTYLPYTVFCGFILLRLCRIWLQVNFHFFLISNIIQKSCKM